MPTSRRVHRGGFKLCPRGDLVSRNKRTLPHRSYLNNKISESEVDMMKRYQHCRVTQMFSWVVWTNFGLKLRVSLPIHPYQNRILSVPTARIWTCNQVVRGMTIGPSTTMSSQSRTISIWAGRASCQREVRRPRTIIRQINRRHRRSSKTNSSKCSAIIDVEITVSVLTFFFLTELLNEYRYIMMNCWGSYILIL